MRGRRLVSSFFRVFFYANNRPYARYAIVVSKKVSKKAVVRNVLKRRVVSWIQRNVPHMRGWDIVVVLTPEAGKCSRNILYEDLKRIFNRMPEGISKISLARS